MFGSGVSQIDITTVLVSWNGIARNIECTDQFLVKYWPRRLPNDYKFTSFIPKNVDFAQITVNPSGDKNISFLSHSNEFRPKSKSKILKTGK